MKRALPLAALGLVLLNASAWACSVCYGDPNSALSKGLTMGVLVLMCVTGAVLFAFAYFFFTLWRRARAHELAKQSEMGR